MTVGFRLFWVAALRADWVAVWWMDGCLAAWLDNFYVRAGWIARLVGCCWLLCAGWLCSWFGGVGCWVGGLLLAVVGGLLGSWFGGLLMAVVGGLDR